MQSGGDSLNCYNQVGIVFPIYKVSPNPKELQRLRISFSKNLDSPKFLLYPEGLNIQAYSEFLSDAIQSPWDSSSFDSRDHYNRMMLTESFYRHFSHYVNEVIICQSDAILTRDVANLTLLRQSYIGASWNPPYLISHFREKFFVNRNWLSKFTKNTILSAGNGGLSYRNLKDMLTVIKEMKKSPYWQRFTSLSDRKLNEDLAIVLFCQLLGLPVADKNMADSIFIETAQIPPSSFRSVYGFHALERINPILEMRIIQDHSF